MTSQNEQNQSAWSHDQVIISPVRLKRRFIDLLKSPYRQARHDLYASPEPNEVLESDLCLWGFVSAILVGLVFTISMVSFLFPVVGGFVLIFFFVWFGFLLFGLRENLNCSSATNRFRTAEKKGTK